MATVKRKKVSQKDITGQQGINLIERIVLAMGCLWHPTNLEAGIDGYIELRDPVSMEVTNCIVLVQSKATRMKFDGETDATLSYYCKPDDLALWLSGNAPVILVHSRPETDEAYWCSIKDRFVSPEDRKTTKITFDKRKDRFDVSARNDIAQMAIPRDAGIYLNALPKTETIESNLLHIRDFPETYFVAPTDFRSGKELQGRIRELDGRLGKAWILRDKMLHSLYDVTQGPWSEVCDSRAAEELPLEDWAFSNSQDELWSFIDLMRRALLDTLQSRQIGYDPKEKHFYFWATRDLTDRVVTFQARQRNSKRTVFKAFKKKDSEDVAYCRHYAFEGGFIRQDDRWYLQINPTYRFTLPDGRTLHPARDRLLSGIKKQDGALSVANIIVMWAAYLAEEDLFTQATRILGFGNLATFDLPVGIDDASWVKREDDATKLIMSGDEDSGDQLALL